MRVTMQRLDKLIPYAGNAKAHPQDQVEKIAASIEEFGFLVPLVIDSGNVIVAGHGRFEAAKHLGMDRIPTVSAGNLTPEQIRAFRIADNRVAESDWLEDQLRDELQALHDSGFDIELTGFTLQDITGRDDELEKRILAEEEPADDENDLADIGKQITERLQEIQATDPERLSRAKAIVLPLKKGSRSCLILADPGCADAIRELKRYHEAGESSPLDCLFRSIFSMKTGHQDHENDAPDHK